MPSVASRQQSGRAGTKSPFSFVPEAQDYLREGVQGFGEQLQPAILKDIGSTLGGLNEIGALRSGGTTVALGDITQKYADIIGAHAKQATQYGLEAGLNARGQAFKEDEAKRARKASLFKAIGSVLGAGIGFIAAGPAGAVAGAKIAGGGGADAGAEARGEYERRGDRLQPRYD